MKQIHLKTVKEVLKILHTSASGLSENEAHQRLMEFGPNQIDEYRTKSWSVRLFQQFNHFFAIVLWTAGTLAFFAHHIDPTQNMQSLGIAIYLVNIINGLFSFWQELRTEKALEELRHLLPSLVKVRRQSKIILLDRKHLVPGDLFLLGEGDLVPADARLLRSKELRINIATLTGESKPQLRNAEPTHSASLLESHNLIFAGTSVLSGEAEAVVFATGRNTELGRVASLTQRTEKSLSPLQREINQISQRMMHISLIIASVFLLIGFAVGLTFWENFLFALGIMIANIPEGLLPTVTLALAFKSQRMAQRKALVKHLPSVETLGCTTVICTDKTGTLTQNRLSIANIVFDETTYEPPFHREQFSLPVSLASSPSVSIEQATFFSVALTCHSLQTTFEGHWVGDPLEIALKELGLIYFGSDNPFDVIATLPFDSERRRMSVLVKSDRPFPELYCKGAFEILLERSSRCIIGGAVKNLTAELRQKYLSRLNEFAAKGFRVLGVAAKVMDSANSIHPISAISESDERDMVLLGMVSFYDPPRPEVPAAVKKCREAGIKMMMITGDHPVTAESIARQIGMVHETQPMVLTGPQLQKMSETELQICLRDKEILFARITAQQKLFIVQALKRKGEVVAVTGDGVNDAPALKAADIGISMGLSGTEVAKASADVILLDDNFATIIAAIEEGRSVYDNIRKFLTYILSSNVPELVPYLVCVLFKTPLPLTIPLILAIDLGTDLLPALGLGASEPHPQLMTLPPRSQNTRLLNRALFLRSYFYLGLQEAIPAVFLFFFYLYHHGWHFGTPITTEAQIYREATTLTWASIVLMQIANVFVCASDREKAWTEKAFKNKYILFGVGFEIIVLVFVIFTPWGQEIFSTSPFAPAFWLAPLPFVALMILFKPFVVTGQWQNDH